MQIASEKYSRSILICARYLGSKFPLNNRLRAWRTFSCIDPTARGNEWTVRQVKENDTRNCCHGSAGGGARGGGSPPPGKLKKKVFIICVDFLLIFLSKLCDDIFIRSLYKLPCYFNT